MTVVKRINTQWELQNLAMELGVRPNWHEPDEQEVTARFYGTSFDNAGFWGGDELAHRVKLRAEGIELTNDSLEMWVALFKDGERVAEVNLATLFAIACGTDSDS
jgi:hypothetical protein